MLSLFWDFILTMWYVNVSIPSFNIFTLTHFILTMWYVNIGIAVIAVTAHVGFILTMWRKTK
ncbi:hypothetical protein KLL36_18575 [Clostridioides difficile]|uniref:hypothetical protein n=1 Tax=Clostridioides difficile TaxID=1496 RepID=UPI00131E6B9F|nr:hypothetical protein [Clostridioides difficile]MDL5068646.1 hypothetical protein [Clostridioides difficile]MDN9455376.1 hypothetical protein [Clostridioides difficile]HBF7900412.1 hypothetical protein [Clostridioides difficile]